MSGDSVEFSVTPGYPYPAGVYGPVQGDAFAYQASDVAVTVGTDRDLGGLSLLGVNPDGSFVLLLDEVYPDDTGIFRVDESVHLFDATGSHLGEAVFPIADQVVEVSHALIVGPDGNTYALLTRPNHVAVARLPYSR